MHSHIFLFLSKKSKIFHLQIFDGPEQGKNTSVNLNHRKHSSLEYTLTLAKTQGKQ